MIKFDEEHILACDEDGFFGIYLEGVEDYEPDYKSAFDEAEIVDYLTDINPKFKPTHEFVQNFIEVFGVEVEE